MASSCHEVQGEIEHGKFEFVPGLFGDKVTSSSNNEVSQDNIGSNGSLQSDLEEGELIEGIEANDVSALLEQFLEYEEKQGSLDSSPSSLSLHSSLNDASAEAETIALKISSFVEAQDLGIDFKVDEKNSGPSCLDMEISKNLPITVKKERLEVHDLMNNGPFNNGLEEHMDSSKSDRKLHVDNHATDHNYACSGFPMRKAPSIKPEVNDCSIVNGSESTDSPKKAVMPDLKQESEKKISNGTEMNQTRKRRLSCDKNSTDKEKVLPKRYRGPYCEDNSKDYSSSDEDGHYYRSRSRQRSSSDEHSNEDKKYYKKSSRRNSLYSNDSSDERDYDSSDEDTMNERKRRYDPRSSESDLHRKRSSGSDRDSDSYRSRHRRKQRSRSKDRLEKRNDEKKNKAVQDIELERKMGFKFDHNIKGTAKEERRIVYIGKISNKTTKDDVWRRFRPFGPIEKVTVHFRDKGDNYAFVTFFDYSSAAEAIERGNEDSCLPVLDICFGGRRKFCGGSYVDFDSNTSYLEEQEYSRPPSSDEMDFDTLLRLSQKSVKGRKESCKGR
ncbi:hypothetical protein ACROYT_G005143 [Oculina patagonica]